VTEKFICYPHILSKLAANNNALTELVMGDGRAFLFGDVATAPTPTAGTVVILLSLTVALPPASGVATTSL
jgi:hypothetical protein